MLENTNAIGSRQLDDASRSHLDEPRPVLLPEGLDGLLSGAVGRPDSAKMGGAPKGR